MRNQVISSVRRTANPKPESTFYATPAPIARLLCAALLLAIASMYAAMFFLMPAEEAAALLIPLLPLIAVGTLTEIALAFLLSWLSPVRIEESGITQVNFWGRKRTLGWGEIESVTAGKSLSLPYLRVSSSRKNRAALVLPVDVTRPVEFREAIYHCASPINPLRRFMESGEADHSHRINH